MVSDDAYRDRHRSRSERAQLLLVGAIAIALVLIGLVVVFNTVLYTDTTSPTETLEAADEAETMNQQVRNDTRRLLRIVANESGTADCSSDNYCTQAAQNITIYSEGLTQSTGHTGPVYIDINVNEIEGTSGSLTGIGLISPCSKDICANITVVYETEQFRYKRTQQVEVNEP